jgi:RNA polymerase sigma-70 factor (ECF subfamily)
MEESPAKVSDPLTPAGGEVAVNRHDSPEPGPGHAAQIDRLFREHNEALLRFLSARLGSYQDAREVAQEAYVRLLKLDRPGATSFLKALLYKTASNLAIDRLRHQTLVVRHAQVAASAEELFAAPADALPAALEDVRVIAAALGELPPNCRSAFLMSRVETLDAAEIGKRLGTTDRAVRKYVARALVFLQLRLQQAHAPRVDQAGATLRNRAAHD